jgi:hypothetical protein
MNIFANCSTGGCAFVNSKPLTPAVQNIVPTRTTCPDLALECKNGGFINREQDCFLKPVPCNLGSVGSGTSFAMTTNESCSCPKGFTGASCELAAKDGCSKETKFDGHVYNLNSKIKKFECTLDWERNKAYNSLLRISGNRVGAPLLITSSHVTSG